MSVDYKRYRVPPMGPAEYRKLIAKVGLTQQQAGWLLGYSDRTSRAWIAGKQKIPGGVAQALRIMHQYQITPEEVADL